MRSSYLALALAVACTLPAWAQTAPATDLPATVDFNKLVTQGPWKVPNPATANHPGIKDAPAASPATYTDEAGLQKRAGILVAGLARNNLQGWRTGYFTGGDPGKYLPAPAMAMLLINPEDPTPRKYMNDDRSYQEQYHFAVVNWARFMPIFGSVMAPETMDKWSVAAGKAGAYLSPSGTENHKTMWMTSSNVLPAFVTKGGRFGSQGVAGAQKQAKQMLTDYVKGLYQAGMGEWDSSTYMMFDVNGMLNVYDFAADEETRLLARAALDYYIASYALKYTNGVYCAPNQRGYATGPVKTIGDQTGWLWWNSTAPVTAEQTRVFSYALHPALSSWRPPQVITDIAQRNLPVLPYEATNTRANYWYGLSQEPKPGQYAETVYVSKHYTMGSLWNGFGVQTSRFQVAMPTEHDTIVFTGGNPTNLDANNVPRGIGFHDGIGKYDQSAQIGTSYICLSNIPKEDLNPWVFVAIPEGIKPAAQGDWYVYQAGKAYVGVRLLGPGKVTETELTVSQIAANAKNVEKGRPATNKPEPIFRVDGNHAGFIVQMGDVDDYPTLADFTTALTGKTKVTLDLEKLTVSYTNPKGTVIASMYQDGKGMAAVTVDGKVYNPGEWKKQFVSPYINMADGVLSINNGKAGYVVDFTGALPVYKAWQK